MEKPRKRAIKEIETGPEKREEKTRLKEDSFINYAMPGEEARKEVKEKFSKIFTEQNLKETEKRAGMKIEESEKSPKQIEIINYANNLIKELLKKEGLPGSEFNIPNKNFHISRLNAEGFDDLRTILSRKRLTDERGPLFSFSEQAIFVQQPDSYLKFFKDILRASLEARSYQEITKFGTEDYRNTQSGISEKYYEPGERKRKDYSKNLNDGIIAKLTKKVYEVALKDTNLPETLGEEIKAKPILEEDKFSAKNREILDNLIEKIYKRVWQRASGSGEMKTRPTKEQLFNSVFVRSFITGDHKMYKLIKDIFGFDVAENLEKKDNRIGDTKELEKLVNEL